MTNTQTRPSLRSRVAGLVLTLGFAALPLGAFAAVPDAARADPRFAQGYLVASYYPTIHSDGTNAAETTAGLNEALADAYAENRVLYLPPGVYLVNDTLNAETVYRSDENNDPTVPHLAMVGSTLGATRPLIRLASSASGFGNASNPKAIVQFRNLDYIDRGTATNPVERPAASYYQMLRNIDVDCGGHAGAIGVYFNQAQESTVENVRVDATGAFAGFVGLPSRAWGAVNLEVEGGQYGIDTDGTASAGSCIVGVVLRNQTASAIRHTGQATTVVGFEIVTRPDATAPALTIAQRSASAHASALSLVDGIIRISPGFTGAAAVTNPNTRNIYLRNVYVAGSPNLVKSGSNAVRTGSGDWSRIDEYSYSNQGAASSSVKRETWTLIDGEASRTPGPLGNGEVSTITEGAPPPPADLVSRHVWASLPTIDDTDYYDPVAAGDIARGNVSTAALQAVIDAHRKVFLPAGIYKLNGTLVLRRDTVLFGAARHLTRLEVQSGWAPAAETYVVTTDPDANATTYLGDLAIGVPARNAFGAVDWQAGANSMLHIARPYRTSGTIANNERSLYRNRGVGGGRWYFVGSGEAGGSSHPNYRILKVDGTTQPLWIYGLNIEHAFGDISAEFNGASNVRVYDVKSEHYPFGSRGKTFLSFRDAQNMAVFSHAALSAAPRSGFYDYEYVGATNKVLATLMIPNDSNGSGPSVYENITGFPGPNSIAHPRGIALYKRGEIGAADEAVMRHAPIAYAPLPAGWSRADVGAVAKAGSAYFGSDSFTLIGSGQGSATADELLLASQSVAGNRSITARVLTQDASSSGAAGVAVRNDLSDTSAFAEIVALAGGGLRFRSRAAAGQPVVETTLPAVGPTPWLRVTRSDDVLAAYFSSDGVTWTEAGWVEASLGATALHGLTATSGDDQVLHTATFDAVSLMTPPTIVFNNPSPVEATSAGGAVVNYVATATDVLGAAVPVVASMPSGSIFPIGTTVVRLQATDLEGFTAIKFVQVTVRDSTAPTIVSLTPSETELWPANHKFVPITIAVSSSDAVDPSPVARIISVTSNEPVDGQGDGDTAPDWEITGALTLQLRAERAGGGSGRVYTITVACTDAAGNQSTRTTTVSVPHSRGGRN